MEQKAFAKLTTRSWHLRLNKWVLGKRAPKPETMFNLCPYFWITIASIFLGILKSAGLILLIPFKAIWWFFNKFAIEPAERRWAEEFKKSLDDGNPKVAFYGDSNIADSELPFYVRKDSIEREWLHWVDLEVERTGMSRKEILEKLRELRRKREEEKYSEALERRRKRQTFENYVENVVGKIMSVWETFWDRVLSQRNLVLYTKRFVGLFITIVFSLLLVFVLNQLTRWVILLIEIWDWAVFWNVLKVVAAIVGAILVIVGLASSLNKIIGWFKEGPKSFIQKLFVYILIYPFYLFFYIFLWKWTILGVIWRFLIVGMIWRFITNFIKVFKEYFGLAYTDFCPGIEWVDK